MFQLNQSPIKRDLTGAMHHINWVLCWWWKKELSCFLHMKKLWNYGHLDEVKGDIFHCDSYSQVFLGDHFFVCLLDHSGCHLNAEQGPGVMNGQWNEDGRSGLPQSVPLCHDSIFFRKSSRNSIFITFQNQLSSFAFAYSPILFKYE